MLFDFRELYLCGLQSRLYLVITSHPGIGVNSQEFSYSPKCKLTQHYNTEMQGQRSHHNVSYGAQHWMNYRMKETML